MFWTLRAENSETNVWLCFFLFVCDVCLCSHLVVKLSNTRFVWQELTFSQDQVCSSSTLLDIFLHKTSEKFIMKFYTL